MSFIDALREHDKKGLFNSTDYFVNYSTGFLPLDYANGFMMETVDEETGEKTKIPITGIMGGKFTILIGWPGSGKTTLAAQIAGNIVRPFEESIIQYIDSEHTALKSRLLSLTGFNQDDSRLILNTEHTSIEDVMKIVDVICENREAGGDIYKYEIPHFKRKGKPVKAYIPTVLVIDSLYTFCSDKFFDAADELDKGTGAMREARQVAEFFNKLLPLMERYNINIICTNHIKPKGNLDPYASPTPQLMMLKKDETVPKGQAPMYLAQNCFRLNSIKSNIYTNEDHGFSGVKTTCQIAKTKTTFVGATLNLAFNENFGYDPIYTLYEFASDAGIISGRNPYLYFHGAETMKFNRKDFRNKFINDTEFRAMVFETLKPSLLAYLGAKDAVDETNTDTNNRYIDVNQLM